MLRVPGRGTPLEEQAKMPFIDNFKTSSVPSASSNDDDARKIFVGGLSWGTTEDDLKEYFSRYGSILDCVVKVDQASGRSRGFGFVLFEDSSTVDEVLSQSHVLQGRSITPRKARKGHGQEPILKIFVGGVDPALPERSIWDHFGAYGKVVDLDLPYDRNKGCRRAFCFVTFESEEAVDAVCKDEKQKLGDKYVDVKRATPKPARDAFGYARGAYGGRGGGYGGGRGAYGSYGNNYSGTGYGGYSSYGGGNSYGTNGSYGSSGYGNNGAYANSTGYSSSTYGNNSYGNNGTYGAISSYGSRMGSGRGGSGRGGYNSRGYGSGGYSQSTGEWGRQQSNASYNSGYGGYYNNNYNNNYETYD